MTNSDYIVQIRQIIKSKEFSEKLSIVHQNFPNQKLENHIRNILVELYNKQSIISQRAFAEHPRYSNKEDKTRVSIDFSICKNEKTLFAMELKYNFPKDNQRFKDYKRVIDKNFVTRKFSSSEYIDAFLLIVCESNKESLIKFEEKWKLNKLSKYQLKNSEIDWKENLINTFKTLEIEHKFNYESIENLKTDQINFSSDFYFYFLYRN